MDSSVLFSFEKLFNFFGTCLTKIALMDKRLLLGAFLVLVVGGGCIIGFFNLPGAWYAALNKPWFNPPNFVFGPAWTLLYVLIALAGWRIFLRAPHGAAMKFWGLQLLFNFLWSPIFFSAHAIGAALVDSLLMWLSIVGFMATARKTDPASALLFAPYLAWVSFAILLNAALLSLN